ncbi:MAG TPA: bifunctional 3'-5' exonuclease/DNA polymerase, partial [Actinotalea sp.]|nr:bifunctional 3'-5' exonuclease/DNA polymerase [Actinotalea sp.]
MPASELAEVRYPPLLGAGVRIDRCHDLGLCHAILRRSAATATSPLATAPAGPWDSAVDPADASVVRGEEPPTLFDAFDLQAPAAPEPGRLLDPVAELAAQLDAVASSDRSGRLRLLLAAESTGALVAAEIAHEGLPWDAAEHDRVLTAALGPRPEHGRPAVLEDLAGQIAAALDLPWVNPDSQPHLLAALRRAGLEVSSTSRYEIAAQQHPVVEPLLAYKKLARLLSANGWAWLGALSFTLTPYVAT